MNPLAEDHLDFYDNGSPIRKVDSLAWLGMMVSGLALVAAFLVMVLT